MQAEVSGNIYSFTSGHDDQKFQTTEKVNITHASEITVL